MKLTIKKEWFDMILSGEKKEEYRELKPYWVNRLTVGGGSFCGSQWRDYRDFKVIHFFNGAYFSERLPNFKIECKGISKGEGNTSWGAEQGTEYFKIALGELINKALTP